ncbi:oxidoreductase domain protein [Actinokineospora spheciospongiae]|uniref:Oxidoreductase domain protein n=1 Tax=Actinokineospora spheciospongiae TaxID=909613 RepID=W7J4U6_9PSEU|nr:Gfo/Idh/MocA family oxidoreductase [Actinokineospora spheciospongiae]EWC64036.1 oxidoreductase domain protein [Actinokineospora spheciospongiae]
MKVGVIGLGTISRYFLNAIAADDAVTLAAVCDLDPARLAGFTGSGVATFTDARDLLDAGVVTAVVITLPNDLHAEVAHAALSRGIAVCCEKPLTVDPADARALARTAAEHAAVLFTAFHRRYNRNLLDLAAALPPRAEIARVTARYHENIGEHTGGEGWYLDPARCGGGCLIDNGPNALDAVRLLVGDLTLLDATIGDVRGGAEHCAELDLRAGEVPVRVELDWALPTGEVKDVRVDLRDGTSRTADLLAGHPGFKASLAHEYRGILAAFRGAVEAGPGAPDPGPALVEVVAEAYRVARAKETRPRMRAKADAEARMVALMFHSRDDRGMVLAPWESRCVPAGQVHELVTTADRPGRPGDRVDRVGFLGFAEFTAATVLQRGDEVWTATGRRIGTVAGFDECHFPNHYNVLVAADTVLTAADLDLRVGDAVRFGPGSG